MKVSSSIRPKDVEILQSEGNKVVIALRDNIIETSEVDLLTGKPLVNYKYDEVKIIARKRDNLLESIKTNFVNWFNKGKRLEELELQIEKNKQEIERLVDDGEQVKVNEELNELSAQALVGVASNYEESLKIQTESQTLLVAISELYEIISGGAV